MDIKSLRRECIAMTDRIMPISFRLAAARQIETYILGRSANCDGERIAGETPAEREGE